MSDRPYNVPFDLILKLPAATGKYSFEGLITKLLGVLAWRQQSIAEASSHSFHKYYLNFLEDNEDTILNAIRNSKYNQTLDKTFLCHETT